MNMTPKKTTHDVYYMCMETTPWNYCGKETSTIAEQNDDYEQHQWVTKCTHCIQTTPEQNNQWCYQHRKQGYYIVADAANK